MAEELKEDWLERLSKELGLEVTPEETEYKRSEHEMPYDPPRDLVQGGAMDKRSLGLKDYGGTTVEPSLEKVVKKKGEQIGEWAEEGMTNLFVGEGEPYTINTKGEGEPPDKPSYMTDTLVRGFGGGLFSGIKNAGEFFGFKQIYEEGSKALDYLGLDHNLVFNLPGFKGFDKDRPLVFLSSDGYLEDKIEKGEAFHLPEYPEPEYGINKVLKPLSRYLSGILMTRALIPTGTVTHPTLNYKFQYDPTGIARDVAGTMLTFKPHEPRLSDALHEYVEDTPIPLLEPVISFLKSDPNDSAAEGYLKIAIEGTAIGKLGNEMVELSMKTYRLAKKWYHAKDLGASEGELAKISQIGAADIKEYMDGVTKTSKNKAALEKLEKLRKKLERAESKRTQKGKPATKVYKEGMTPEEELVLKAVALGDSDIETAITAMLTGKLDKSKRVLNIGASQELGWEQVIGAIAAVYKKRNVFKRTYHTIQSGKHKGKKKASTGLIERERQTATQKKGEDIYDEMTEFEVAATLRGESSNKLKKAMLKKYKDVKDAGAHMFAYRVVLRDLSLDLANSIDSNLDRLHDPQVLLALQNDFQQISDLYFYYGNIRGELGRAVTSFKIEVPPKWLDKGGALKKLSKEEEGLRNAFISAQMSKNGWNPDMVRTIGTIMREADDPLKAIALIDRGIKAVNGRIFDGVMEVYRNIILGSTTVFETAIVSGTVETFYPMARDMIGNAMIGGVRTLMGKPAQMDALLESAHRARGIMLHYPRAAKQALYALMHERNVLDPLRSVVDETNKQLKNLKGEHELKRQFAIAANPNASDPLARTLNLTGQAIRLTTRGIGSIDEFLKQINYGAWAYGKVMMRMPDDIRKAAPEVRRVWAKQQLSEYYDRLGRATSEEGLNYARKIVFQEDLVPGSLSADLQAFIKSHPPAELYVPIMRTPANVVKRLTERTVGMSAMRSEVRRKWNGTPEEQAEVLGDVTISTTLLGATASLITSGQCTGAGPSDPKQRALWEAAGYEPYSCKFGDNWYPYDRLAPFSGPLMMVANVYENSWKYNNNKEEIGERMLLAIMQSLGDMHFISNFYNFFKMMEEAGRTGEIQTALVDKPILKNARLPKIIGQGFHAIQGHDDYKEIANIGEQWDVDIANLTGNWESLGGEKWNWITGEKIERDISYWSGYAWKTYEEIDPVIQELVRMGFSVTAPQRWRTELGIQLTPEQFADYKMYIGTQPMFRHPNTGKRMKMIESLRILMGSSKYAYDANRVYPDNPGPKNWRLKKVSKIIRAYKDNAWNLLLEKYPKLAKRVEERQRGLTQYQLQHGEGTLPKFEDQKAEGYDSFFNQ
tara:strand:- start:678 stop:4679 length:4002 start_codon:yes stop_codon:yes gene_type:complete